MILLFHADDECMRDLCRAAGAAPVRQFPAGAKEENTPLGMLAGERISISGLRNARPPAARDIKEPMAVLADADQRTLDRLLANLTRLGRTDLLKAVLTGTNRYWNARQLYGELTQERDRLG